MEPYFSLSSQLEPFFGTWSIRRVSQDFVRASEHRVVQRWIKRLPAAPMSRDIEAVFFRPR